MVPPPVEAEERRGAVHPLDEARASAQRGHGVVRGVERILPAENTNIVVSIRAGYIFTVPLKICRIFGVKLFRFYRVLRNALFITTAIVLQID